MKSYNTDKNIVYFNGEFVDPNDVRVNIYSQTLHYGNGVFEGIRSYKVGGEAAIFRGRAHYERFLRSAELMGMKMDRDVDQLLDLTNILLEKNDLTEAYIRPLLVLDANMSLDTAEESYLIIQCWQWGKFMGDKTLRVMTSSFERPNPRSCYVEAKVTGHYINSILATNEAKKAGYDAPLLLDMNGHVAESSGANIFMERNGVLYTPTSGNILTGITRNTIMDICKDEGITVAEEQFTIEELKQADSAFFVGTAAEVVGIESIDDVLFEQRWDKSIGHRLMGLYQDEVYGRRITT